MTTPLTDGASQEEIPEEIRTVERLRGLRERVTTQMGGPAAIGAIHAAGRRTAREHIAGLVDPGSFGEIGTFATGEGGRTNRPRLPARPAHRPVPGRPAHRVRLFHRLLPDRGLASWSRGAKFAAVEPELMPAAEEVT